MPRIFQCGRFVLTLDRPYIMAILNVTPDSFSGDGLLGRRDATMRAAEQAMRDGADLLDIGGESSRPGAAPVSEQEELDRVIPLVEALASGPLPVSVDTMKPAVMRAAIAAGASMINDINAFRAPGALDAMAAGNAGLCIMHMLGEPRTMQAAPTYNDVLGEVSAFLQQRKDAALVAGVAGERILLDPGFGFGKTLEHNLTLFRRLGTFNALGCPLLVGVSRKSMLGAVTGRPVAERMPASVVAAALAVAQGAAVIRVHDVAATSDALKVWHALAGEIQTNNTENRNA